MKKFMLRAMPVLVVLVVIVVSTFTPVYALDIDDTFNKTNEKSNSGTATNMINKVWGTVLTVLQILAVAAIVFAGVKYMFAGADQKAEIKNGLIVLVIGAILVFGASTVVRLIINVTNDVTA